MLRWNRHANKLRTGHLHGNRFNVLIRETASGAEQTIAPLIDRIKQQGLPNFYGPQRFGRDGETARLGIGLLRANSADGPTAERKREKRNPFLQKLALSAGQSTLFNLYLTRRVCDGFYRRVLEGDVMSKRPFGGLFVAKDLEKEQQRFDSRETMHTGPIFGRKMFAASATAAAREAEVLKIAGLNERSFAGFGKLLLGTRRPNIVYIDDLAVCCQPGGTGSRSNSIRLSFSLSAGSYATILLREVMKTDKLDGSE